MHPLCKQFVFWVCCESGILIKFFIGSGMCVHIYKHKDCVGEGVVLKINSKSSVNWCFYEYAFLCMCLLFLLIWHCLFRINTDGSSDFHPLHLTQTNPDIKMKLNLENNATHVINTKWAIEFNFLAIWIFRVPQQTNCFVFFPQNYKGKN